MPNMKKLLPILLAAVATACTRTEAASSDPEKSPSGVRIEVVSKKSMAPEDDGVVVRFRVANGSASGIGYRGWANDSPAYSVEVQESGEWTPYQVGWCGTGLIDFMLQPGAEMGFDVRLPADGKTYRATLGDPMVVTPSVVAAAP